MQRLLKGIRKKVRPRTDNLLSCHYKDSLHHSDVLLRHRRRCHPTPPPADRSSRSPPAQHRLYPGVPVSSSRNDYRELSPEPVRQRKRARANDMEHDAPQSRPRHEEDEDDLDDDEQFGESSQFGRHNGMGNGGVYNGSNFYPSDNEPAYTPHLLPNFQHNLSNQYQSQPQSQAQSQPHPAQPPNESVHLEDASVLLSMAYPTGMPMADAPQAAVADWETGQQTINAMMEAAQVERTSRNNSSSEQSNIDPVFSSYGNNVNLLGPTSWMQQEKGQGQDQSQSQSLEGGWVGFVVW
jgi:hypothetical protein